MCIPFLVHVCWESHTEILPSLGVGLPGFSNNSRYLNIPHFFQSHVKVDNVDSRIFSKSGFSRPFFLEGILIGHDVP